MSTTQSKFLCLFRFAAAGWPVSVLSRRFGVHRVELREDAVQTALPRAVQSWPQRGAILAKRWGF